MSQLKIELPSNLTIQQAKDIVSRVENLVKNYQHPQKAVVKTECVENSFVAKEKCFCRSFGKWFKRKLSDWKSKNKGVNL